jgi:glycosyltransferase involved in cell wall biosynthesis/2-polyprenyl-3-methyl-5-hydroxy-6-metoxy-1,4-benzoquinol methylase
LAVVPSDPLQAYAQKGRSNLLKGYYNPGSFFDEVYCLSPLERTQGFHYGMHVIPTRPEQFAQRIRELGIHIVRAYGGYSPCDLACQNKVEGVPVVVSVHDKRKSWLHDSIRNADFVLSMSKVITELLLSCGVSCERIYCLGNRVDMMVFRHISDLQERGEFRNRYHGKYLILHVGRKSEEKNLDTVIDALSLLGAEYACIFIGTSHNDSYRRLSEKCGVAQQCYFIESVPNNKLARYYSFCDCMCTPSRTEGFGVVFIEALACQAVVVTSDIAPMNEYITNNVSGILVQDFENPAKIAEAIFQACTNQSLRDTIQSNARAAAEPFSKERIDQLEVNLYDKFLNLAKNDTGIRASESKEPTHMLSLTDRQAHYLERLPVYRILAEVDLSDESVRKSPRLAARLRAAGMANTDLENYWKRVTFIAQNCHGKVLELGCGCGNITRHISQNEKVTHICAVDIQHEYIDQLRMYRFDRVEPVCADVLTYQFCGNFDCVVIAELIEHLTLSQEQKIMSKLSAVMSPGATAIITTPIGFMSDPDHVRGFSPSQFREHLQQHYGKIIKTDSNGIQQFAVISFEPFLGNELNPRVSVVLPTHNHLKFLPRAIESILSQTFSNFELIIVNDGSTDGTREYLDTLKDPRIRVIHQDNKHLPEALNAAFRTTHGDLLTWVSADNYCAPAFLETFVAALEAHPGAGLAYSAYACIDEHEAVTDIRQDLDLSYHKMLTSNSGVASFMYRRICQEKVGLYDPGLEGAEDWDYWLRILEHFETVYIPEVLYYYRRHDNGMTKRMPEKVFQASQQVLRKTLGRQNHNLDLLELYPTIRLCQDQRLAKFHACFDLGTNLLRSSYADARMAAQVLERAHQMAPDSVHVTSNLAVAYARLGQWEQALPLLQQMMTDVRDENILMICRAAVKARQTNNPESLSDARLFSLDKKRVELFQLEQRSKRVFCPAYSQTDTMMPSCQPETRQKAPTRSAQPSKRILSVVLTTYNRPELLERTLAGFANQTAAKEDYEVIVVDDGSDPPVKDLVEKFQGQINTVSLYQENSGLAAARNAGIRAAKGQIVLFSDDDDVPGPELIAEHLRSHRENPDERIAVLGHLQWHPDLHVSPLMHYVTKIGGEYFGYDKLQDGQFYDVWKWWGGLVSAKLSLLNSVEGPFDSRLRFGYEDTELACRLLRKGVKVLYNSRANSFILRAIDFESFCERRYMQGRALYRVAVKHPEIIIPRYQLQDAAQLYQSRYAPFLDEWSAKAAKFEPLLTGKIRSHQSGMEKHLRSLYSVYRECFLGYWLKGYVEEMEAVRRGHASLNEPVNAQNSPGDQITAPERPALHLETASNYKEPAIDNPIPTPVDRTEPDCNQSAIQPTTTPLRITFVNTNTPGFDVGSSNLRIYHILKILADAGHKIDHLYFGRYEDDTRYKAAFDGAVTFIKTSGTLNSFIDYLHLNKVDNLNYVWMTNLWSVDYLDLALQLTQWLKRHRPQTKVIVDTMDFHYKKYLRKFNVSRNNQDLLKAERFLELEKQLYQIADKVLTVTEVEKRDILQHVGPKCNVGVIPNMHRIPPHKSDVRRRKNICFLGSFRVRHNVDGAKWFLQKVLPLIAKEAPEVRFDILGFDNEKRRDEFEVSPNVKVVGYVEDAESALAAYRLFVCPMVYGAGMKGKLGVAAAAGTPFVTTTIGAEGFDFADGQDCFIADEPGDFAHKCLRLLREDSLWAQFSTRARSMMAKRFSIKAVSKKIDALLQAVATAESQVEIGRDSVAVSTPSDSVTAEQARTEPKVSVVTACRNSEKFLRECVDSIRNQTLSQWELFLLDDGSTDGTPNIIEEYSRKDERIKAYCSPDCKGPYVRRNFALERVNSDFIVIHDADDIMSPRKLEILHREITADDRVGVVGSFFRRFMDEFKGLQYTDCHDLPTDHNEILAKFSSWGHAISHGSAIIRKKLFDQIGLYDGNPFASDTFWFAKLGEFARHYPDLRFTNVPEYLTLVRVHSNCQTGALPCFDPRNRRIRYRQYCECKLRRIREKLQTFPDTDIGNELRDCDCSDFLDGFKDHIVRWESQPLHKNVIWELEQNAVWLFNQGFYVNCISTLNGIEVMAPDIAKRTGNYDLLRAMAFFALDMKEQSLMCLNRELQNHKNPAAKQFISDYFDGQSKTDVQKWCAENSEIYDLRLIDTTMVHQAVR